MRIFSLKELASITEGEISGDPSIEISTIFIDSRRSPDRKSTGIFVAIRGPRNDGHTYIPELYTLGVKAFIVSRDFSAEGFENAVFLKVREPLKALQKISAVVRSEFEGQLVAITGSNGKTIIKEWIYQILHDRKRVVRSPESYNSQVGVPLSLLLMDNSYDLAIIEAGISQPGEMERLEGIVRPDIGIITNIGSAHQENFHSLEQKAIEKLSLFVRCKSLVYCTDYREIEEAISMILPDIQTVTWGRNGKPAYRVTSQTHEGTTEIRIKGKVNIRYSIPFTDHASVENSVHIFVLLLTLGFNPEFISDAMKKLEPVAMRLEILKGANNCTIINDSYNSDLISLYNAVHFLNQQKQNASKTLILSDILQSGRDASDIYGEVSGLVQRNGIELLIGIGEDLLQNASLFSSSRSFFYKDTDEFLKNIEKFSFNNEAILLKGSRKYRFELITSVLQEKSHRTTLEIDLNALVDNYRYYKSILRPSTKIMAMVKAFSYGSGGVEIANTLQYHKADYLAVAFADEGIALRKNGISLPIMVMNAEKEDFPLLTGFMLEPEMYNFKILTRFGHFLSRSGITGYPVHIKIDTGMHRLGFSLKEINTLGEQLNSDVFRIASVFSHLAAADDPSFDEFTRKQIDDFTQAVSEIRRTTGLEFLSHILNSAGAERFPENQFDMVRLGIGLYGVSSFSEGKLREVSTFQTKIAHIMELDKSETVGYGRKGRLKGRTRVATLPVGYADGLPRSLGNGKASFLVNQQLVPTIGNICMDMCMVDITQVDAGEGDRVEIFGKAIPVKNMAEAAGTIPYEILSGISARVRRIYYRE